ncbi:MAG: PTS fructose transporter subunit IIA [Desulfovibrionales bacterium GWA2_65_9]|nr:MAG: PTS fructose transporter subunit IIA [Desulfovibrionales bacterium GWA2_65_9]
MQLSVKDAATLFRVSEDVIYGWIKDGVIPAYHIDNQYRFNRSELLEWATSRQMDIAADVFEQAQHPRNASLSLADALQAGDVLYGVQGSDKTSVLRGILDMLTLPEEVDREFLFQVLLAREALGSTGIGGGIAIPHVRNPVILHITKPAVTICFLKQPIDFQAIDGQPVHTLFLLITPTIRAHLHLLSRLGLVLRDKEVKAALGRQAPRVELLEVLTRAEAVFAAPCVAPAGGQAGGQTGGQGA